jgi:hypothetical protein
MSCQDFQTLILLDIPQANQSIATTTGEGLPVGTPDHGKDGIAVSLQGFETVALLDIPESYHSIAATSKGLPIGTPADRPDQVIVSFENFQASTSNRVPDSHAFVSIATSEQFTIGTPSHWKHRTISL